MRPSATRNVLYRQPARQNADPARQADLNRRAGRRRRLSKALATRRYLHVVWMGIYRLSVIKSHELMFEPGLHHQDIPRPPNLC